MVWHSYWNVTQRILYKKENIYGEPNKHYGRNLGNVNSLGGAKFPGFLSILMAALIGTYGA